MNTKQARICELRQTGMAMAQVAKEVGCSKDYVKRVCVKNGIRIPLKCDPAKLLEERNPQFEYVGGFTNCDGSVDIRCKICGHVENRSLITIRKKHIECDNCKRIAAEQKEKQRKIDEDKKEWAKVGKQKAKQLSFSVCECCGELFYEQSFRKRKYCSTECYKKVANATSLDKRLRRITRALVDKDISLKKLFTKYDGVCALCGKKCNYNDCVTMEDGTFVAHGEYPSIDHVVPLSKGGKHEWNNVQLAHLSCNSRKYNHTYPSPKNSI